MEAEAYLREVELEHIRSADTLKGASLNNLLRRPARSTRISRALLQFNASNFNITMNRGKIPRPMMSDRIALQYPCKLLHKWSHDSEEDHTLPARRQKEVWSSLAVHSGLLVSFPYLRVDWLRSCLPFPLSPLPFCLLILVISKFSSQVELEGLDDLTVYPTRVETNIIKEGETRCFYFCLCQHHNIHLIFS